MDVPAAAAASVCAYGILIHVKRRERVSEREREREREKKKEKRIIISTLQYRNHLRGPLYLHVSTRQTIRGPHLITFQSR